MGEQPLRILQIMRAPVGGLFRHVSDLTRELAQRGHLVGIVADSTSGDAQTDIKLATLADASALGIHRLPMPRVLGMGDITTPLRIRRLAKSLNVSILHGHGAKGGVGARAARLGSGSFRAIYTPHGGTLHFDPKSASGRIFMGIERGLLAATDALIFESRYAQTVFAAHVAAPKARQEIVHNGLAPAEFDPIETSPGAADFVYVGELRMLKGIDLLVSALAPLRRPDGTPATLVMAGDGPDRNWLEARIAELDLADRVTLAGVQPARSMFARGHCVVVPSRAESLPYVVLEATAANRPLIATSVGGIAEIFGPTASRLVAGDDADALRAAMADFLVNTPAAQTEADERRRFVRSRFSVERMVDGIEALYLAVTR